MINTLDAPRIKPTNIAARRNAQTRMFIGLP